MAQRRLNKKVAFVGSAILVVALIGSIFVLLNMSKSPKKLLEDAEAAVIAKDYDLALSIYGAALKKAKKDEVREEILMTIVDVSIKADRWDSVFRNWGLAIAVNPNNAKARFGRLKYLYIVAENRSESWQQVHKDATEFLKVAQENDMLEEDIAQWNVFEEGGEEPVNQSLGAYLHLVRARAMLEMTMLGVVTNKDESLAEVEADVEEVRKIEPENTEVYRYLAGVAIEKGKLLASRGLFQEEDKSAVEAKTLLEEAVRIADDDPMTHVRLLTLKVSLAQRSEQARDEIQAIEPEYASLVKRFPNSAEAYVALAGYYSTLSLYSVSDAGVAYLDKAIEAAEKVVELDKNKAEYVINAMNLHRRKFSVTKEISHLNRSIELANSGVGLPDAVDKPGPWSFANKMNRYQLYSYLARAYIQEVLEPSETRTESETAQWLANAEQAVHEIEQIFKSGQEPQVVKWRGMIELAKGNRKSAIKRLYAAYEQIKAVKPATPPWRMDAQFAHLCYVLARVFRDTSETGAVAEFMTSSLYSGISSAVPEARLDYVETIMKFHLWSDAIENIDAFEKRLAPNQRSKRLRIATYIGAGEFDNAAKALAEMPKDDLDTMRLSLSLVQAKIKQTQLGIARLKNKQFLDVAFEGLMPETEDGDARGNLDAMEKELDGYIENEAKIVDMLLPADPNSVTNNTIIGICKHYAEKGGSEKAKALIDRFLVGFPKDWNVLIYKRMLSEPDPATVTKERQLDIEKEVLSNIVDPAERALRLGIFYRREEEYDKAIAELEKALKIGKPYQKPTTWFYGYEEENADRILVVGHLFDLALETQDWTLAEKAGAVARQEDLDDCNGDVYAARLAFAKKEFERARTLIDECLKQRPVFSRAYSLRSNINAAMGDEDAAIEDVRRATSMNPLDGLIAKGYAQLLYMRNKKAGDSVTSDEIAECKGALQRAMSLNPGDMQLRSFYADFVAPTEPLKALAILQALRQTNPTFTTCLRVGALATQIARDEKDERRKEVIFAVAGAALNDARAMKPDDKYMLHLFGEYLRAMGRDDEAIEIFGETGQKGLLWNHYYQRGQYDEAKAILEQIYAEEPNDTNVLKGLVLVAEKTVDANAAAKYSEALIAADPTSDNHLIQIQSFLRVGLVKEASLKLQSFTEKYPDEPRTLLLRAWLEMRTGQLQKARELTNRYLEGNPNNAAGWRLRGEISFYEGDITKAIDDFKKSKSLSDSDDVTTRVVLAKAYLRVARYEDAITELKNAIQSPGAPTDARLLLDETYRRLNRKNALIAFYNDTINEFPNSVFWLNRAAGFALDTGDYDRASSLYAKSFELKVKEYSDKDPGRLQFDALYAAAFDGYLRSIILQSGMPNTSKWNPKKLDEVFELAKDYVDTHYAPLAYLRMGQAKLMLGHKKTAIEYCQKAVDKAEANEVLASEVLLRMFLLLGPDEVEKFCLEKLKSDQDSVPANFTLFNLYKVNGQYDKSVQYISDCIRLVQDDSQRTLDYTAKRAEVLTLAYQRTSDNKFLEMAVADFESLLKKMPNNTSVLNNLAYMLAAWGQRLDEALMYAEKVYSLVPNDPGVLDTYGYVLFKNGKYSEAIPHFSAAIQLYEQKSQRVVPEVYEHLGLVKEAMGDKVAALAAYKRAIEAGVGSWTNKDKERVDKAIERLSK
ncbi:MAG: tetratricopeptide repeat protein [Sedimentisphaerales bacterium]|nr:tetratricopeptide repeat protein [Sedimentisphaerales bacterium]